MSITIIKQDVFDTTKHFQDVICENYENHSSGSLRGYLILDKDCNVIPRKKRKYYSAFLNANSTNCLGSVKCRETRACSRSLTAMVIAYSVRNNLMEIFQEYPFEKFEIELETYPQYQHKKSRFKKYRKTGDDLTFLKADIKW